MKSRPSEPKWHVTSDNPEGAEATPNSRSSQPIEAELDALKQRLAGAEAALGTMRRLGGVTVGLITIGVIVAVMLATIHPGMSQSSRTTVRAPFRVVDAQGRLLLHLDADQNGTRLRLFDGAGEPITMLGATPEGGIVRISSRGDRGNLQLYADAHGGQISLTGQNKAHPVAWLGTKQEGGGLGIYDAMGCPVAWVTTANDRRGLSVGDQAGRPVAWLGAAREGGVAIYDRSGKTAAYLTIARGSGSLAVYDPARKKAATLTADTDLSGRMLRGPSIATGGLANPAAGGTLTRLATRPRTSADPRWLLHRRTAQTAPHKSHPGAHPIPTTPALPEAARSSRMAPPPQSASHRPKSAVPGTVIGPESETGPQGITSAKLEPAAAGTGRAPGESSPAKGSSGAKKAQAGLNPSSEQRPEGTRPSPGAPAGTARLSHKLLIAARPHPPAAPLHASRDSRLTARQAHARREATGRRFVRWRRHGRRHHLRRVYRYHRRHRRWLRHSHHWRRHAHRTTRRLARRPLHSRWGNSSHRLAVRTGALLHPQRADSPATGGAPLSATARQPNHSPAVTLPTDPD